MSLTAIDVSGLLAALDVNHDASSDLAATVSKTRAVTPDRIEAWIDGEPLLDLAHLRGLAQAFPRHRQAFLDHIDDVALLAALWCTGVGAQLTERRQALGLRPEQVAAAGHVSPITVRRWEKSHTVPRAHQLEPVLRTLGLDAGALLTWGDWPPDTLTTGAPTAWSLWLTRAARTLGVSESMLARSLGCSQPTVNAWVRGRAFPREDLWEGLAAAAAELHLPLTVKQLALMAPVRERNLLEGVPTTHVATLLQQSRIAAGLDQVEAGDLLDTTYQQVRQWERGAAAPVEAYPQLMLALRISREEMIDAILADTGYEQAGRSRNGALLEACRVTAGYSQRQLAGVLGVSRIWPYRWEQDLRPLTETDVAALTRVLDVPPGTFEAARPGVDRRSPHDIEVGAQLREERLQRGLSQAGVGRMFGLTQSYVSSIELGYVAAPDALRAFLAAA